MAVTRVESKVADAMAKGLDSHTWDNHSFIIRISEFPSFIQRKLMNLFIHWIETMAEQRNDQYSVYSQDMRDEAYVIWSKIRDNYR
jgi:hypothetical protein